MGDAPLVMLVTHARLTGPSDLPCGGVLAVGCIPVDCILVFVVKSFVGMDVGSFPSFVSNQERNVFLGAGKREC